MNNVMNTVMNPVMTPVTNSVLKSVTNWGSHLLTTSGLVKNVFGILYFICIYIFIMCTSVFSNKVIFRLRSRLTNLCDPSTILVSSICVNEKK